jgi:hypothetical protein
MVTGRIRRTVHPLCLREDKHLLSSGVVPLLLSSLVHADRAVEACCVPALLERVEAITKLWGGACITKLPGSC